MPFVNGQYSAPASSWNPAVPGTTIESAAYNSQLSDVETALSTCVLKDGTQTITANIPMSGFKFTGVNTNSGNTSRSEFVSGATYQDGGPIDAGTTAGSSTVYTATLSPAITAYVDKQCFRIQFDEACGAGPTINFNAVGARKFYLPGGGQPVAGDLPLGYIAFTRYDSTLDGGTGGVKVINPYLPNMRPQGRLTLTTLTPVLTTGVSAATTVYYTPYTGNLIPILSTGWDYHAFSELSLALDSNSGHTGYQQSGKNFDLFVVNDAGTLRLGTGPAWSTDTARGTGAGTTELTRLNGILVNAVSMTLRFGSNSGDTLTAGVNTATYVGTMRASANGQTSQTFGGVAVGGTAANLYLWNMYNRVDTYYSIGDSTDAWNYTTPAFRPANNSTNMAAYFVLGIAEDSVVSKYNGYNSTSSGQPAFGVGLDSTTAYTGTTGISPIVGSGVLQAEGSYVGIPGLGYHFFQALEYGNAGVQMFGDAGSPTTQQNRLYGTIPM